MDKFITEKIEQNGGYCYFVREIFQGHIKLCTNEKVQSRISSSMSSDIWTQIPENTDLKFSKICKIKSTGKIRIKVYDFNDKFMGWISYKKDNGDSLINLHEGTNLDIFSFPDEIPLY